MAQRKQARGIATTATTADKLIDRAPRAKRGVKAGLKDGETRVTCVLTDDQNQILHDWAKQNNRTFREVTMAMAERYIAEVIQPFAESGRKLRAQAGKVPPATYADYYEDDTTADMLADFDQYAR